MTNLTTSASSVNKITRLDVGEPAYGPPWEPVNGMLPEQSFLQLIPYSTWSEENKPDLGLTLAVQEGFSNSTQAESLESATCETGNCLWPKYKSLDVCSSCTDVSSHVVGKKRLIFNNADLYWFQEELSGYGDASECIIASNNSFGCYYIDAGEKTVDDGAGDKIRTNPSNKPVRHNVTWQLPSVGFSNPELAMLNLTGDIIMAVNATSEPSETFSYKNLTTMISTFTILKAANSYLQKKSTWNGTRPVATECALYFCVNEYDMQVINGTLNRTVTPSPFERNPASYGNSSDPNFLKQSLRAFKKGADTFDDTIKFNLTLANQIVKYWFTNAALWRREGTVFDMNGSSSSIDLQLMAPSTDGNSETFNVSANTVTSLIQYVLSWSVAQKPDKNDDPEGDDVDRTPNDFLSRTAGSENGQSPLIDMLYNSHNMSLTFANAARSMSNYIQNVSAPGQSESITGTSMIEVIHIKIQWPFIVLPAVTLLTGYVYVLLVLWQTWRLKMPTWKESVVPLLSRGLNEEGQGLLRYAEENGRLRAFMRTSRIDFNVNGDIRLRLRRTDSS